MSHGAQHAARTVLRSTHQVLLNCLVIPNGSHLALVKRFHNGQCSSMEVFLLVVAVASTVFVPLDLLPSLSPSSPSSPSSLLSLHIPVIVISRSGWKLAMLFLQCSAIGPELPSLRLTTVLDVASSEFIVGVSLSDTRGQKLYNCFSSKDSS